MRVIRAVHRHSASGCFTTSGRGLALATLWCALLAASVVANDDHPTGGPAIPPGQERLIATMLGKGTQIGDCKLVRSGVEYTVIRAIYKCRHHGGRVTLELSHRLNVTAPSSIQAGQFAITLESGSPPLSFQDALVSRVRSRESDFVWTWAEPAAVDDALEDEAGVTD